MAAQLALEQDRIIWHKKCKSNAYIGFGDNMPTQIVDDFESILEQESHIPISLMQKSDLTYSIQRSKVNADDSFISGNSIKNVKVYRMKPSLFSEPKNNENNSEIEKFD